MAWLVIDPDSGQATIEQLFLADALVLSRKTYEGLAAVWPQLVDDPTWGGLPDASTACRSTLHRGL